MSELRSWNDTETTEAIVAFAEGAAQTVPPEERIAVFDHDGTLWCEKLRHLEAHGSRASSRRAEAATSCER